MSFIRTVEYILKLDFFHLKRWSERAFDPALSISNLREKSLDMPHFILSKHWTIVSLKPLKPQYITAQLALILLC